jgi:hypothetical protein
MGDPVVVSLANPEMAAAIREYRAAESQFQQADSPAFSTTNSALTTAKDRIALIAGRRPKQPFVLPWLRRKEEGLRCAS